MPREPLDEEAVIVLALDGSAEGIAQQNVPAPALRTTVRLKNQPSPSYAASGWTALVDEKRGTPNPFDGKWLGFEGDDFEAVMDLHSVKPVTGVVTGCLQAQGSLIFFPRAIEVWASADGTEFHPVGNIQIGEPTNDDAAVRKDFSIPLDGVTARFMKIRASNVGVCPAWHKGAGIKAWVFVDEIQIEE